MTSKYSDRINYFDWPKETDSGLTVDWTLDEGDENQLKATCDSLDTMINYLEQKVEQRNGIKKNPSKERR